MTESYERLKEQRQQIEEKQASAEEKLLGDAMTLLERATFHDGRYGQSEGPDWLTAASALVTALGKRLHRIPYRDYNKAKP